MLVIGIVLILSYMFGEVVFKLWGWCLLFVFSIVLVLIGLWVCKNMDEL